MKTAAEQERSDAEVLGHEMHALVAELFPICRSITGNGLRETLNRLKRFVPIALHEVPTGTPVFDWTVPPEWNIRDAYIKNVRGERVVDFQKSNLHVMNYSVPVHERMKLEDLRPHLFTLPEHPDWIPYRTAYYKRNWGFCLTHNQLLDLVDDEYEVCIDASLENGHLTYGEVYIPGDTTDEILISSHVCHPSLANDNLSGVVVACFLANHISRRPRRYSYRFLFVPGTIGAITWLSLNKSKTHLIKHGLVLAGVGDAAPLSYKRSRRGNAEIDRIVEHTLRHSNPSCVLEDFSPYGYDERQFCSPGFNLAVGRLSRSRHGQFPEYHTSADNLDFVRPESLEESLRKCLDIFSFIENNNFYSNQNPMCEPQLGKRGLYSAIGGTADSGKREMGILWTLNLSDGHHTLLDIAERSGLTFREVYDAARLLTEHGLLRREANQERDCSAKSNVKEHHT